VAADLKAQRQELLAEAGLTGPGFCRAYTALADRWLGHLLDEAAGDHRGLALVAVGGYGRREMCPGSDFDVLLVHAGRKDVRDVAERVWYPLWDAGLKLSHGVRTPKEALALAADDLDTATALLDLRPVAGDDGLAAELGERARAQWQKRAGHWLDRLGASVEARHAKAGEVAFLLEPDLKDGRGGLRDVHAIRWAEPAARLLWAGDEDELAAAHDRLLAVRVELHRRTGRPNDVLLLQEQDGVAEALGHGPPPAGADRLMAEVAAAARAVAWTSDDLWRRVASARRGPSGRLAGGDRPAAYGVVLRDGEVHLSAEADPGGDPGLVLRAASVAAGTGRPLSRVARDRLADEAVGPGDPWPDDARHSMVALLAAGHRAIPVIEALDHHGLLVRLLPEWEPVRSRPQRNAYHRFTVDRHLCEAAAEAAELTGSVPRPDLLLLGAWLHDIGKGYPGDHTDAGVELVAGIAKRMGFPAADIGVLCALVRHHLLLPDLATRRNVADDATVSAVVDAVGDLDTLVLLHALTEADGRATGPAAWGPWKAGLVGELVARSMRRLEGREEPVDDAFPTPAQRALVAERRLRVDISEHGTHGAEIPVVSPDRPGLFSRVAGTLALHGLDVLAADAWSSDDGMAIEVFRVEPAYGSPDWSQFRADLDRALAGRLSLEARLAERSRAYARRILTPVPLHPRVVVHDDASATATVVEVRAPDAVGVLYRITRALAELQLDIRHAKVATLGAEVVDSFYVLDATGQKVSDPDHVRELEQAVLVELGRV
jgi:[protein-PII] uridylyltransferase